MAFKVRTSCEACGSSNIEKIFAVPYTYPLYLNTLIERHAGKLSIKDLEGVDYEISKCRECGLLFQKFVPDKDLLTQLYSYDESRIEKSLSKKRDAPIEYYVRYATLVEKLVYLSGKRPYELSVLDFGSGWGYFLTMARAHGLTVTGVEVSPERSTYAKSHGIRVVNDLKELTSEKFDIIYSDQTLEHVDHPLKYLQSLTSLLRGGGIAYLGVPNCKKTESEIKQNPGVINKDLYPLEHLNGFSNKSLQALAKRANLSLISPWEMLRKLLPQARPARNSQFLLEGLKAYYTQARSTDLYFKKRN
jgi:2-polyprenyl-3-methyl-5-hydroxy-6-metoxy-1,4-benzoquinol methylase